MQTRREEPAIPPSRKGAALGVQWGSLLPMATSTQNLLVVLSGSVQGKRDGARPPTLDTANPRHEKSVGPPLASASKGWIWAPHPTPHGAWSQDLARQQQTEAAAGQPDTGEGRMTPAIPKPSPLGEGGPARTATRRHSRQDTARRARAPVLASRVALTQAQGTADPPTPSWPGDAGALQCLVGAVLRLDELDDEEDHSLDAQHQHDATDETGCVETWRVKLGTAC